MRTVAGSLGIEVATSIMAPEVMAKFELNGE
jgi:hypothetical protein